MHEKVDDFACFASGVAQWLRSVYTRDEGFFAGDICADAWRNGDNVAYRAFAGAYHVTGRYRAYPPTTSLTSLQVQSLQTSRLQRRT